MRPSNARLRIDRPAGRAGATLDDASIGRIEDWVVRALDGKDRPAIEADWRESLENFTLAKRPETPRNQPSTSHPAPQPGAWARFRLARRRGVAVVSLTDQALIKEEDLDELAGDLRALVEAGHLRVVLDFFAVERLSSWAARTINEAARSCRAVAGGELKFSGLRPDVASIFAMTGLDPAVLVYPDTKSAVDATWPDLPELRPLPVSILAALMRAEESRFPGLGRPGRASEGRPAMTRARLIVQDGPDQGRSVTLRGDRFVIGRGRDCQLRLGSSKVSRAHASLERRGGRLYLRDLASTNGSLLNGKPVRDREVEVNDGDRLRFGPITFALEVGHASSRFEVDEYAGGRPGPRPDMLPGPTEEFGDLDLLEDVGFKHEVVEGVLVVTPLAPELSVEAEVDAFRDGLLSLVGRALPDRVVVNLSHVGQLSGRAIGVLVAHHLRLDRSGGALRVCLANPRVALVLEQVKLGLLVECHTTVDEAVIAAWPEPAAV